MESIRRGEIYFANLSPTIGSEQSGLRPVLILQNNMGNQHSPTTIVAPITGTSMDKRDEFLRLIRDCKRGKIDRIITKSVARFARNTVDCLTHTRMLKEYNVDVYFEEQGIHSMQPGSEFYITIYGSIAQSESENISANVKWGKAQSAREGNVSLEKQEQTGSIMSMQHDCFPVVVNIKE